MEKNRESNLDEREILPLERARFLDLLEPSFEEQWSELLEGASGSQITLDEFALTLWNDESFPAVIRDRAMLMLIGKQYIGKWKGSHNMGYLFSGFRLNLVRGNEEKFKQWFDEALDYGDIINDRVLLNLSYVYFTNGDWDQDRFERTLEGLDYKRVQPVRQDPWDDYELDPHRLPFIDDILNNVTVDKANVKMKEWAKEKYDLYTKNFIVSEENLPSWLRDLEFKTILKVVEDLYPKVENDETLPPNIIATYEKYNIGFYNGLSMEQSKFNRDGSTIIKHLDEFSQRAITIYLRARYENAVYRFGVLSREEEQTILSYVKPPIHEKLLELADKLDHVRAKAEEEHAIWLAKEKEDRKNREKKREEESKKRQEAESRFENAKRQYQQAREAMRRIDT